LNFTLIEPTGVPQIITSTLQELQDRAVKTRPDIAEARSRTIAAAQMVRASHEAYGPSLSSFANVEADNPHFTGGGNTNLIVGAKAEIQLFDGGARRAEVSKSIADREIAEATPTQAETQASLQVRQAFFAVQPAHRQYTISNQLLTKANETLRTALDRYGAGLATITEVLGQQDQLRSMELNRVESLYRWWTAEAQLRLASGADIVTYTGTHP
jgi:outer membrane protein TolC